ncbi:MAG: hypothetical protein ACLFUR_06450 [Candidatus Hadarchaeia archaeon]
MTKKKKYDLVLTDRIEKAWDSGEVISAFVEGKRGYGKSAYCLKVAQSFYYRQGYDFDEAWEKALDSIYFKMDNIIDVMDEYSDDVGKRTPIIIWDDIGIHANKYTYFNKMKETEMLKGLMDVIRTITAAMLMTTPSHKGILKFLKEYDNHVIQISKRNSNYARKATGYEKYTLPSGTPRIAKDFEDYFECYVPKQYYDRYQPKREKLAEEKIQEIKELAKQHGEKKEKAEKEAVGIA